MCPRNSASASARLCRDGIARSHAQKPLTLAPTTRHSVATAWLARSAATKANLVTRSPERKSRSFPEDLDFLFEPLDLAPETLGLGLLGFAGGERLSRARGQLFIAPLAQLPRADIQFSGDIGQRPATLDQALNRLGLILTGKPSPGSSVCIPPSWGARVLYRTL